MLHTLVLPDPRKPTTRPLPRAVGRSVPRMLLAFSDLLAMMLGLAAAFGLLLVGFRLLVEIGRMQGRKGYGDESNRVGRLLTSLAGAFVGRNRR